MIPSNELTGSLGWYRRHQLLAGALFWMPTAFLYLVEQYGLTTALRVQAVYYAAVVVLEVPSGWLSDRLGRVLTLRLVAVWWLTAHLLFIVSPDTVGLVGVVLAQIFLAAGYAFLSGTDVMLHFDTLEAIGRADEFDEREASSRRGLLGVTAITALAGGAVGLVDLRLPFALSLVAAAAQLAIAWQLIEPPRSPVVDAGHPSGRRLRAWRDLVAALRHFGERPIAWLGLYVVAQVVTVHLAADLTGPYLADVLGDGLTEPDRAALATGATAAAVALVGALIVPAVPVLSRRVGLAATLLGVALIPTGLLVAMALTSAIWLLPLLALRGVQGAATSVLVPAVVGGHVEQERRATVLSLNSLGGRLLYGGALLVLAATGGEGLGSGLTVASVVAAVLLAAVLVGYPVLARGRLRLDHDHEHEHPAQSHEHLHVHHDGGRVGDGHHEHAHHPPFVGAHAHVHEHDAVRHAHRHTADSHHRHEHD
ncbi:MAG: MFS transporter [Actinomycetota bacterium]